MTLQFGFYLYRSNSLANTDAANIASRALRLKGIPNDLSESEEGGAFTPLALLIKMYLDIRQVNDFSASKLS